MTATFNFSEHPGVQWWNSLSEADRRLWLALALTAVPAVAWEYFQLCNPRPSC